MQVPTVNPPGDATPSAPTDCAQPARHSTTRSKRCRQRLRAHRGALGERCSARLAAEVRAALQRPLRRGSARAGWRVDPFSDIVGRSHLWPRRARPEGRYRGLDFRRRGDSPRGRRAGHDRAERNARRRERRLCRCGVAVRRRASRRDRQRYVVITEPLDPERVCIGHRGVYWFEVTTLGRTGHGSMPSLAVNAAEPMARVLSAIDVDLRPRLAARTSRAPVEPPEARRPSISLNALHAGQPLGAWQSPCVPDRCTAMFDRRFLHEEAFEDVKIGVARVSVAQGFKYELSDLMRVDPLLLARTRRSCDRQEAIESVLSPAEVDRQPRHVRSEARRPARWDRAVHRLWPGPTGAGASARRVRRDRRPGRRDEGHGAGGASPAGDSERSALAD